MKRIILVLVAGLMVTACGHRVYIVRHAEKEQAGDGITMSTPNDPPLSNKGKQRAEVLREMLSSKKIKHIFSTNTLRSRSTAAPLSEARGIKPEFYSQVDEAFINRLRNLKSNSLVVGHSNTVDDLVNNLTQSLNIPNDLPDSSYNNLYIVTFRGWKIQFEAKKYGPSLK